LLDIPSDRRTEGGGSVGMTERARVAGALKCFQTKQKPCRGCDYNPRPGTLWPYGCGRGEYDIAEDAKRLLREDGTTKERGE